MGKFLVVAALAAALVGCEPVAQVTDAGIGDAPASDAPPAPVPMCVTRPGAGMPGAVCDETTGWAPVCNQSPLVALHWERRDPVTGAPSPGGICLPFLVDTSATATPSCTGLVDGDLASCASGSGSPQCLAPNPELRCPEWFY